MAGLRLMRGVILEGELYGARNADPLETVRVFLELEDGILHARRAYGERASILSLNLDDVEAALAALKYEATRKTTPTELEPEAGA